MRTFSRTLAALLLTVTARAATFTWDGGGANDDWSSAANWLLDAAPPPANATDDIVFTGGVRLAPVLDADRTIGSLTFAAGAGSFTLGTNKTLTLGGGGLAQNSALLQTIAHALVLNDAQAWSIGSGGLTHSDALGGSAALTKTGPGTLTLGGGVANTLSGTTTVQAGTLRLGKSPNVTAIAGPLVIGGAGDAARVEILATGQIADSSAVTLLGGGSLELTSFADTIGALTIDATAGAATVTSTGANLGLASATMTGGSITVPSSFFSLNFQGSTGAAITTLASAQSATISGRVSFVGTRSFIVADGAAPVDLDLPAVILGGSGNTLDKQGPGTLRLSGANAHDGGTTLTAGTILLGHDTALGAGTFTVAGAGRIEPDAAPRTLANPIAFNAALTVGGALDTTLTGAISGTVGSLVKVDASLLTLAGTSANAFTGATTVQAGTLVLEKTAGVNALGGNLAIGTGATARLAAANQIADTATVTVASGATFDMNGNSETIGALVLQAGAAPVTTGAGTLTVNGGVTMSGGSISGTLGLSGGGITTAASATTATITGMIDHGNPSFNRTYSISDGAAAVDLDLSGASISGNLTKTGNGTLRASLPTGTVALNSGTFEMSGNIGVVDVITGQISTGGAAREIGRINGSSISVLGGGTLTIARAESGLQPLGFDIELGTEVSVSIVTTPLLLTGGGILTLSGDNIVNAASLSGPVRLTNSSGSALGEAAAVVSARLEGIGSFAGRVSFSSGIGTIAPGIGLGTGRLTGGKLDMSNGLGVLEIGLAGTTPVSLYDQLAVRDTTAQSSDGTVLLGGTLSLSLLGGFDPADGAVFYILDNDGTDAISGTFSNITGAPNPLAPGLATFFASGQEFAVSYAANWTGDPGTSAITSAITGGNDIALIAVPEPGAAALLALGMCALVARGSRRSRA